ncbi:hypothetical protein GVO57_06285 [Sphingomonas changnyeongensis]|uniref:HTH luxR-type domain-containing protein n=1 Tax=Sphingomonas changnyeongensis TaxID=2698679 RepID=A0A7Z2NW27_9SPHN|nr:helix-turn-helix transcriptional regulator [Sphingomonas changnyeongensis]QHL90521.1 hypothetical protein GVO57_06285 [Sphingomonas changnyeongensis]
MIEGQPVPLDGASAERISAFLLEPACEELTVPGQIVGSQTLILIRALRLEGWEAPWGALELRQPAPERMLATGPIIEIFGLTAAEARVAEALANGMTATDIALKLGKSLDTVRSHIKSLYTKIGVNSREALLSRLHTYGR